MEGTGKRTVVRDGFSFGSALAICISWSVNHSVVWAVLHGICSWLYVIYWCVAGEVPK